MVSEASGQASSSASGQQSQQMTSSPISAAQTKRSAAHSSAVATTPKRRRVQGSTASSEHLSSSSGSSNLSNIGSSDSASEPEKTLLHLVHMHPSQNSEELRENLAEMRASDPDSQLSSIAQANILHAYMDSFLKFEILDLRVFRAFHRAGFSFEARNDEGDTILLRAARGKERDQLFRFLINECGVNLNRTSARANDTGLHLYIRHGPIYLRTLQAYLEAVPVKFGPFKVNSVNSDGNTVLHELLLQTSRIDVTDELCNSVINMLLQRRFNVHILNNQGLSALALAQSLSASEDAKSGSAASSSSAVSASASSSSIVTSSGSAPSAVATAQNSHILSKPMPVAAAAKAMQSSAQVARHQLQSTISLLKRLQLQNSN